MVRDEVITVSKLKERLEDYTAFLIFSRSNESEAEWLRKINSAIKIAEEVEKVLRSHGFKGEVVVSEVVSRIRETWKVKWKEARSGRRRPTSIRKIIELEGNQALFMLVPKCWKNLAAEVLKFVGGEMYGI